MTASDRTDSETHGGSVESNESTIQALRQGVHVERRMTVVQLHDHIGEPHEIPVCVEQDDGGKVSVSVMCDVIEELDGRAVGPRFREGTAVLGDVESLVDYVNRHKRDHTVAFAPLSPPSIRVVFDFHGEDGTNGWCTDRAKYEPAFSRQWRVWTHREGPNSHFTQADFGDFVEVNSDDLRGDEAAGLASAARMLEVARNLVIHTGSKYERTIDPTTGTGTLIVSDEHTKNSTKIPKRFGLAIPVFEGSATAYLVECQLRMVMHEGRPRFSYVMLNREAVREKAAAELREAVRVRCGIPVFVGEPPNW